MLFSSTPFAGDFPVVVMDTSEGVIEIELNQEKAPVTVANFLQYVNEGFYHGLIFHRVISNFVIQGGGHTPDMQERQTHAPIICESKNGLSNDLGTIAMARESAPHTATAQFYVNVKDNPRLNHRDDTEAGMGYAVFGKVIKGIEVVHKIKEVPTITIGDYDDVPVTPIMIKSVTLK